MKIKINECVEKIKQKLHYGSDLKERKVQFFGRSVVFLYIADLTDIEVMTLNIVSPIVDAEEKPKTNYVEHICKNVLTDNEIMLAQTEDDAVKKILKGYVVVIVDAEEQIICVNAEKITVRSIETPPNSVVVKGPRQGFNESLKHNLSLIRQRLATDKLVVHSMVLGRLTQTQIAVCYLENVASKKVVKDIIKKLSSIDIDGVLDSSYIATFLQRKPNSMFKQVGDTEKPDILCGKLLEGRVGIIVDGSPIVLTLPFVLIEDLQNSDDYYNQHIRISFMRLLRIIGITLAVLLPGLYIALQLYHYKILPLEFLITIMNTTQGIPFTPFTEILFVVLLFEVLYEANLRMPQYLGMALSIVGALILGETAVNAGLVSPPAVMIVALSGLTFYVVPHQATQFTLLRLIFIVVGTVMGLFGLLLAGIYTVSYLCSFDSYDSAYLAPLAPFIKADQKDLFMKFDQKDMKTRPLSIANNRKNLIRMSNEHQKLEKKLQKQEDKKLKSMTEKEKAEYGKNREKNFDKKLEENRVFAESMSKHPTKEAKEMTTMKNKKTSKEENKKATKKSTRSGKNES